MVDLENELSQFRLRGAVIAKRPEPAVAFDGRPIAWVITAEGFLVELLEQSTGSVPLSGGVVRDEAGLMLKIRRARPLSIAGCAIRAWPQSVLCLYPDFSILC